MLGFSPHIIPMAVFTHLSAVYLQPEARSAVYFSCGHVIVCRGTNEKCWSNCSLHTQQLCEQNSPCLLRLKCTSMIEKGPQSVSFREVLFGVSVIGGSTVL